MNGRSGTQELNDNDELQLQLPFDPLSKERRLRISNFPVGSERHDTPVHFSINSLRLPFGSR